MCLIEMKNINDQLLHLVKEVDYYSNFREYYTYLNAVITSTNHMQEAFTYLGILH